MSCCGDAAGKPEDQDIKEKVKEYYGKTIQKTSDLGSNVSCINTGVKMPKHVRQALQEVHDEVTSK